MAIETLSFRRRLELVYRVIDVGHQGIFDFPIALLGTNTEFEILFRDRVPVLKRN